MTITAGRPATSQARQVCSVHGRDVAAWCGSTYDDCLHQVKVDTTSGVVVATSGDWVIRAPDGTFSVAALKKAA